MVVVMATEATVAEAATRVAVAAGQVAMVAALEVATANQEGHSTQANASQGKANLHFLCMTAQPETACTWQSSLASSCEPFGSSRSFHPCSNRAPQGTAHSDQHTASDRLARNGATLVVKEAPHPGLRNPTRQQGSASLEACTRPNRKGCLACQTYGSRHLPASRSIENLSS